jgi:predicted Na+-dependent transporter
MSHLFASMSTRIQAIERSMSQRANLIKFLVVRFVLMSGMVVGFAWTFLQPSP